MGLLLLCDPTKSSSDFVHILDPSLIAYTGKGGKINSILLINKRKIIKRKGKRNV